MYNENKNRPILITGAERSGTSLIARICSIAGVFPGDANNMFENIKITEASRIYIRDEAMAIPYPKFESLHIGWNEKISSILKEEGFDKEDKLWLFKSSLLTQMWETWNYAYPDAKWIIVRRKTADIINSCLKTNYMSLFKSVENRFMVGAVTEEEAWLWWIHQYEEAWVKMIEKGVNVKMVWPERMVTGDYHQIYEMLEWLGLEWSLRIPNELGPLLKRK